MTKHSRDFAAFRRRLEGSAAGYEKREAPDLRKIQETLDAIGEAFEARKKAEDERYTELAKRGVTPETEAKLTKIDAELDRLSDLKKDLELLVTRASRPGLGAASGARASAEAEAYKSAFVDWMRSPSDFGRQQKVQAAAKDLEKRATQTVTSTGSAGGFALPEEIESAIARLSVDISPIRQIATVRTVSTSDYKELFDVNGAAFEWLAEAATRNQTNTSDLAEVAPTMGTGSARPRASEESLDDLFFNVEAWLIQTASEAIAQGEGAAFVGGNGTARPTGFLAGPTPVSTADSGRAFGTLQYIASGGAAALPTSADVFYDMIYAARARYRANARWVTSKAILAALRKYKDSTNAYLWQPSLSLGQPDTFMGFPISEAEDMQAVAANSFPLAFGDFREGYLIVDRVGMRMTRDEITLPGFVQFYIRKRVGGKIRNSQAIKLLKIATS